MSSIQLRSQSLQQQNEEVADAEQESQETCTHNPNISYRQYHREQQSQKEIGEKTRGRTRAIKWRNERKHTLGVKPTCHITKDMKRIICEKADQFITEVGHWLRTILPLRCRRWNDMDVACKERLFKRIKAEWIFPEGENVDQVVENQCKVLYRQWRYRLKEQFFDGNSVADALKNCPNDVDVDEWKWIVEKYWGSEKQKLISQVNRFNRSKQKVKATQGPKSTARVLEMLRKNRHVATTSQASEQAAENMQEATEASQEPIGEGIEPPFEPEYLRLWEETKRHKDKSMDKFAEEKLEEFKQLHQSQLELHGVDNLTVEEAYMRVLGTCSGYINGLGFGPKPPKGIKGGNFPEESSHLAHQMAEQFDHLEWAARNREDQLNEQIQGLQRDKVTMLEEIEKMKKDVEEREQRMREREEKMRSDFQEMVRQQLLSLTSTQLNLPK